MKKMRIVGLGTSIIIQVNFGGSEWEQKTLSRDEFRSFMESKFPVYWEEYLNYGAYYTPEEFFYHYGETSEMRRKGEAYIYDV